MNSRFCISSAFEFCETNTFDELYILICTFSRLKPPALYMFFNIFGTFDVMVNVCAVVFSTTNTSPSTIFTKVSPPSGLVLPSTDPGL